MKHDSLIADSPYVNRQFYLPVIEYVNKMFCISEAI